MRLKETLQLACRDLAGTDRLETSKSLGDIVFKDYSAEAEQHLRHLTRSCNKSMVGIIAESLIPEGTLNPDALVSAIIPEVGSSVWANATVGNVLDIRISTDRAEDYTGPDPDAWLDQSTSLLR